MDWKHYFSKWGMEVSINVSKKNVCVCVSKRERITFKKMWFGRMTGKLNKDFCGVNKTESKNWLISSLFYAFYQFIYMHQQKRAYAPDTYPTVVFHVIYHHKYTTRQVIMNVVIWANFYLILLNWTVLSTVTAHLGYKTNLTLVTLWLIKL